MDRVEPVVATSAETRSAAKTASGRAPEIAMAHKGGHVDGEVAQMPARPGCGLLAEPTT